MRLGVAYAFSYYMMLLQMFVHRIDGLCHVVGLYLSVEYILAAVSSLSFASSVF